jgi:oligopeptide/dipeptide ABC transporter ATP-binding protein
VSSAEPLFEARDLVKLYEVRRGVFGASAGKVRAVDGVSLAVARGETLGLVGESGSGKSTTGRLILRLEKPTAGQMRFDGEDWSALSGGRLRAKRRDIQMVFQDPQSSLHPLLKVGDQVAEPLRVQRITRGRAVAERVAALLADVGLSPAAADRYPAELSGGQRQRVAIARALATGPKLLVCDEPVSALDVSVAGQILNLLADLRERRGMAAVFIAHDLAVVARVADRIAVFYCGRIVEEGPAADVVARPLHPYTVALLAAATASSSSGSPRGLVLAGEPPSRVAPPSGCAFHPRCPIARPRCAVDTPPLEERPGGHAAACFYAGELRPVAAGGPPV